eukprot:m.199875 g.199875  ORF g.199875 m.199875 type:complete len:354 (-) comp10661_c3_seq5:320-1381(-)
MKSAHDAKSSLDASGRTVAPKSIVQGDESSVSGQSLANERVRVRMQKRSKKEAVSEKPKSLGWPCLHPQGDVAGQEMSGKGNVGNDNGGGDAQVGRVLFLFCLAMAHDQGRQCREAAGVEQDHQSRRLSCGGQEWLSSPSAGQQQRSNVVARTGRSVGETKQRITPRRSQSCLHTTEDAKRCAVKMQNKAVRARSRKGGVTSALRDAFEQPLCRHREEERGAGWCTCTRPLLCCVLAEGGWQVVEVLRARNWLWERARFSAADASPNSPRTRERVVSGKAQKLARQRTSIGWGLRCRVLLKKAQLRQGLGHEKAACGAQLIAQCDHSSLKTVPSLIAWTSGGSADSREDCRSR